MTEKNSISEETGCDTENSDVRLDEKEIARRKMLKKLALGTGVVATSPVWVKPVVKSVLLPRSAMAASSTVTVTVAPPV